MITKKCIYCGKTLIVRLNKMKYHQECYFKSLKGEGNPFFGRKHSHNSINQMSESKIGNTYSKGKKRSLETRKKISELAKKRVGNKNPFYGKKHTKSTKERISRSRIGKCLGELNPSKNLEVIEKIKRKMLGRKITWTDKISTTRIKKFQNGELIPPNLGKLMTNEQKLKISKTRIERGLAKLEKNPMWKGGLSYEPYPLTWTKDLREKIRELYQNKCILCGNLEISKDKKTNNTRKIPIHHINYVKKDVRPINLIPLCTKCHSKVNKDREYWIYYFCNKLRIPLNKIVNNEKVRSKRQRSRIMY